MNHAKVGRKFGRKKGQRASFMKVLAGNLIRKGKITTTEARAKELRPYVEKLITTAKKQNLASLKTLISKLDKKSAEKLYYELAKQYAERKGGYIRIIKTEITRKRDASRQSIIEFV